MGKWPDHVPVTKLICPARKTYPIEISKAMAAEMQDLLSRNPKAVTPDMIRDYHALLCGCIAIEAPNKLPDTCKPEGTPSK